MGSRASGAGAGAGAGAGSGAVLDDPEARAKAVEASALKFMSVDAQRRARDSNAGFAEDPNSEP